jgi:hypothetical protein
MDEGQFPVGDAPSVAKVGLSAEEDTKAALAGAGGGVQTSSDD